LEATLEFLGKGPKSPEITKSIHAKIYPPKAAVTKKAKNLFTKIFIKIKAYPKYYSHFSYGNAVKSVSTIFGHTLTSYRGICNVEKKPNSVHVFFIRIMLF